MIVDFDVQMLQPIYTVLGVGATLVTDASDNEFDLIVIDKSDGIEVALGNLSVPTMRPAVAVRRAELVDNGIELVDLNDATITFNGHTWQVVSGLPKANPQGEESGEVYIILSEET